MPFVLFAVVFGGLYYLFTPQLSIDNGVLLFAAFLACVIGGFVAVFVATKVRHSSERAAARPFVIAGLAILLLFAVQSLVTLPMFRANSYQRLLGQAEVRDFKSSLPPLQLTDAPLVSYDMAMRAAEKKLSSVPALGSQAQVGELQKQLVGGKLYWVGFLQHRGFWTWLQTNGTPGYVRVSATDPSDVELVTQVTGKKLQMRFLPTGYFGDDAERHLRMNGYATKGLMDLSPEIDDEGRPFLVATVFERKIGFSGKDAVGVVLLDVQTGTTRYFPVADAPAWVDRIQPAHLMVEQLADQLEYIHGWWNPSHTDMLSISGDMEVIYGTDGRAHFFAGLGSTAREGGLVGFVLIDSRTKAVQRYNLAGVTEQVAQHAAQGVFPEKHYTATNALPFMVEGVPAYVMALRDATGIPRSYGVVDITDYQKVAVSDTLEGAVRLFQSKLQQDRTHVSTQARADEVVLKAKVLRVGMEVRSGTSNYVFVLEGHANQLYTADVSRAEDLSVTQAGDQVEVRTLQAQQRVQPVLQFTNLTLQATKEASVKPAASASSAH